MICNDASTNLGRSQASEDIARSIESESREVCVEILEIKINKNTLRRSKRTVACVTLVSTIVRNNAQ